MAFNWKDFATGFLERSQEIRKEREEEAKTFEEEQREAAERNAQTISQRNARVDVVMGYANYLRDNGVSDEQIQAVIASGPEAIQELTQTVQTAVRANRGRPLAPADVEAIISLPEGFSPTDLTTEEFVRQTFGLGTPTTTREPAEETTFLGRTLFGAGAMDRARDRLNRTDMVDGMTIEEINAAARQSDYESLIPGTFVTINQPDIYDPTVIGPEFIDTISTLQRQIVNSDTYAALRTNAQREEYMRNALLPIVDGYADRFGGRFLNDQENFLGALFGQDFATQYISDFLAPEVEEEQEGEPAPSTEVTRDGMGVYDNEIQVSTLEPLGTEDPDAGGEGGTEEPAQRTTGLGSRGRNIARTERREGMPTGEPTNAAGSRSRRGARARTSLMGQGFSSQDIDLITESGGAMQDFALQRGVTTQAQMEDAIQAYISEQGITPPQDLSFIAAVLFKNLVDSGDVVPTEEQ